MELSDFCTLTPFPDEAASLSQTGITPRFRVDTTNNCLVNAILKSKRSLFLSVRNSHYDLADLIWCQLPATQRH